MSKAAIGLAALGIGATTAVAAPIAMTLGGGSGENEIGEATREEWETPAKPGTFKKPNWKGALPTLTKSKDIKDNYQNTDCIKDNFKNNIEWNEAGSDDSALSEAFNFNLAKTNGCLIVDYYKQEYEGDKWWGEFKLSWSLIDDLQHGFVIVVQARTQNAKLVIDSAIYVLGSKDSGWEVKYNKDETKEVVGDSELSGLIPQPGSLIKEPEYKDKNYWGFNPQLTKICKEEECTNKKTNGLTKSSAVWKISHKDYESTTDSLFADLSDWFKKGLNLENEVSQLYAGGMNFKLAYEAKSITEELSS